jgi:hypothetical protein
MIAVSDRRSVYPVPSSGDCNGIRMELAFDAAFKKRWSDQMVLSWRFYYFDLDRINASMENNLCTEAIAEEYTKVNKGKEKSELKLFLVKPSLVNNSQNQRLDL